MRKRYGWMALILVVSLLTQGCTLVGAGTGAMVGASVADEDPGAGAAVGAVIGGAIGAMWDIMLLDAILHDRGESRYYQHDGCSY